MAITRQAARKGSVRKASAAGATPSTSTPLRQPSGRKSPRKAAPPSGGAGKARKKRRNRPGTVALREIRKYQKSWELLVPAPSFIRTVREISFRYAPSIGRWQAEALVVLWQAAMDYIVELFGEAMPCAFLAKCVTLMKKDFELARGIGGKGQPWG